MRTVYRRLSFFFQALLCLWLSTAVDRVRAAGPAEELQFSREALTVDGRLEDPLWQKARLRALEPQEPGVPQKLAGDYRVVLRGAYLCIGAFCPEPGGKALAFSVGYNPVWARDAYGSPELEDRWICRLEFTPAEGERSELALEINPWGALRLERNGKLVPETRIRSAAGIDSAGWRVEAAVPLAELQLEDISPAMRITVTRTRSRRALAPEYRWQTSGPAEFLLPVGKAGRGELFAPAFAPPVYNSDRPKLRAGRVQLVPPLELGWDDPSWRKVPGFELSRNEPLPRRAEYPTEVKWLHDGRTLAFFFRCTEDERVDCDNGARDSDVGSDDHVCLYLSTSGSSVVEILVNPAGAVRDSRAAGPHMYRASGVWNGNIAAFCDIRAEAWTARIDLPLAQIAQALGETGVPSAWRVLFGRLRQPRPGGRQELSTVPVLENPFLLAPARYAGFTLTDLDPAQIEMPAPAFTGPPPAGLAVELAGLESNVLSPVQRKYYNASGILENDINERIRTLAMEEHAEWDSVETLADWEAFRDRRISALSDCLGAFPRERPPLDYLVTGKVEGEGYVLQNIIFQSRTGFYVAGNLYLPSAPSGKVPGIIIVPSHHYPKTQGELQDCGMLWACCGCAVLVLERLGAGERTETLPWHRQHYQSEYQLELQLGLVGQTRYGWMAWDVIRAVDLLSEMDRIDRERIILIGSVAGGGIPSALAGIYDKRPAAVIPFNFGRVYWWDWGIPGLLGQKITPWFIYNAGAPRKFVYAHEFSWEGEEGPEHPTVWVPAWPRYKKVYSLYGAEDNLAVCQGTGLLRVPETAGDCWSLGPAQRMPLYPVLQRWFGIPMPGEKDRDIRIDSELGFTRLREDYAAIRLEESQRRLPDSLLLSITPQAAAGIERRPLHRIARDSGLDLLKAVRERRSSLDQSEAVRDLKERLSHFLGDIEPSPESRIESLWTKKLSKARAEALIIHSGPRNFIPLLILKPEQRGPGPFPLVIAVSEGGKDRFLKDRSREITELLENGVAVLLPDVRGVGETAPDQYNRDNYLASKVSANGRTLLGERLKDLRTVLAYAFQRTDFDKGRLALWGESFAAPNAGPLWVDELAQWPVSPQVQRFSSPLGAHLALLAALYEDRIKAVVARGGLCAYLSLLESSITYAPPDIVVPAILEAGDIADICSALAPRLLLLEAPVDGRNFLAGGETLRREFERTASAYERTGRKKNFSLREGPAGPETAAWLNGCLAAAKGGQN